MSKREGIVVSVDGRYVNLLTPYGEFIKVKCKGRTPSIGEEFKGNEAFNFRINKVAAVACIILALFAGGGAKAYYSPVASVVVGTNPQIELKVNFLNRIISYKSLNSDGNKILNQVTLNNKNINDALQEIIDKSKGNISIDINGKSIDISKFKSNAALSNLNIKIESNGNIILNKSSNKDSNKNANGTNTLKKDSSLGNKSAEKRPNSNYGYGNQNKINSTSHNNSNINKNSGVEKSNLKQSQNPNINSNKEEQSYKRQVDKNDNNKNKSK